MTSIMTLIQLHHIDIAIYEGKQYDENRAQENEEMSYLS
jgi:hypothetical protein